MHNEIVIYQSEMLSSHMEVRIEDETVWLTQLQMATLFQTTRNNITLHIGNLFKEQELEANSVSKDFLLTASDGKKYKTKLYNLDVIISVGYRVKSKNGRYSSASEVIRSALRLLEQEEKKEKGLIKSLEIGELSGFIENFDPKQNLRELHRQNL